jgi:hypothetical protein
MENMLFEINKIESDRIRIEVYYILGQEIKELLGVLYFEKAKKSFKTKPLSLNEWLCVDAKVEGLYTKDEKITPSQIISLCQKKIKEHQF